MADREKIIKVIDAWASKAVITEIDGASVYNPYNASKLADALIEAGFGDVFEKSKAFVYANEIAYLDNQLKEYKHRAEVAERALRRKCESEADSTCPCDENSDKCKVCAEKGLCSTEYATQCYYERAIHQAEREIEDEERKDD